ncbi:MAG: TonB-dependent receptor [Betaproteobacteria bacterium]|nr:TonB-dependent receptor [Betaproteobacteria bacterium]
MTARTLFHRRALPLAVALACSAQLASAQAPSAQPPKDAPKEAPKSAPPATTPPPAARAAPTAAPAAKPGPGKPEQIEVTGTRSVNSERRDASASKIIITRDDIEQYGDSNLGDVMRRLPGVTTGGRPGRPGPPRMRGMGGGFTQILINGERIPPGFSIEQITPDMVERIEILRAPTAETGARAIAGTINVILREALRQRANDIRGGVLNERGKLSPEISVSRNDKIGETGTYNVSISSRLQDQLTDNESRTIYRNLAGNVTLDQNATSRQDEDRKGLFLTSRFQWRLGPGEQFSFQPFYVNNKSNNFSEGRLNQTIGSTPAQYATSRTDSDFAFNVARFMTMLNKRLDESTTYELRGGGGQFSSQRNSLTEQFNTAGARTLTQYSEGDAKDRSFNIAGKINRRWGEGHNFATGFEWEQAKRTENAITVLNGVRQLADFGEGLDVKTKRQAFFIQDEWDPSPKVSTSAGLRWEGIETTSDLAANPVKNKSSVWSPLAHMVYRFSEANGQIGRDQVRVSLTQSYRPPSTQDLVSRPQLNTLFPVPGPNTTVSADRAGNPNLKPETAHGIDIAYENYLDKGGVVSVNLFHREIKNLIRTVTELETVSWATSPRYVARPQNLGGAKTTGLEFDAKFSLIEIDAALPAVNVKANASFYASKVEDVPGPNNRIADQGKMNLNLGADYKIRGTPLSVGANVSYTPGYDLRVERDQFQTNNTKRQADAYVLWNITSGARLRFTLSNISPKNSETTNLYVVPDGTQSITSTGKSYMAGALRFEMKL